MSAINTLEQFVDQLQLKMGVTAEALTEEAYENAATSALMELGWSLPVSHPLKAYWALERAVRHSIFILSVEAARKFRYKQIHLNHRFEHYNKLIEAMDLAFEKAKEANPELFADSIYVDDATLSRWITYLPNDRQFNHLGKVIPIDG